MTKLKIIQALKYVINFGISGYTAWLTFLSYAIWVLPPIRETREASIDLLKSRITSQGLILLLIQLIIVGILAFLTWLSQEKIEKRKNLKELVVLSLINILIVTTGLVLGIMKAYEGLMVEISRHF